MFGTIHEQNIVYTDGVDAILNLGSPVRQTPAVAYAPSAQELRWSRSLSVGGPSGVRRSWRSLLVLEAESCTVPVLKRCVGNARTFYETNKPRTAVDAPGYVCQNTSPPVP